MTTSGLERANRVHGRCSYMHATDAVGEKHRTSSNTAACAASRSFAFPAREPIADDKSSGDRFDALQGREPPRAHPARGSAVHGWRALRLRVPRATPVTNRREGAKKTTERCSFLAPASAQTLSEDAQGRPPPATTAAPAHAPRASRGATRRELRRPAASKSEWQWRNGRA